MAQKKKIVKNKKKAADTAINEFGFIAQNQGAKTPYLYATILGLLAFLLYANTIGNGYVLDDTAAVLNNPFVQKGFAGIPKLFSVEFWYSDNVRLGYYRPLALTTYAIEHQFFGNNPHISHFFNALFFAFTGFMLFLVLKQIIPKRNIAFPFLATLVFIAHPIHTEVVANIKSRDEILSFLGILGMLYFALRSRQKEINGVQENVSLLSKYKDIALSLLCFYLALISKETAITGIVLLPFLLFYSGESIPSSLKKSIPYIGVVALFFLQKYAMLGYINGDIPEDMVNYPYVSSTVKFPTAFKIFAICLKQLIAPYPLTYDYSYNQIPAAFWKDGMAVFGLFLFIGLAVFALMQIKKKSAWGLGLGIIFITIVPSLAFVFLRGGIMAERFLYAPVLGFAILLIYAVAGKIKTSNVDLISWLKGNTTQSAIVLFIFVVFSGETIGRNRTWKDALTLFSTDVKHSPNSCQVHRHYGETMIDLAHEEKDSAKRIEGYQSGMNELQKALEINPNFGYAYFKMGIAWYYLNRYDSAIKYFNTAIETDPRQALAYNDMGIVYQALGKYSLASFYYHRASLINPQFANGTANAASLKASTGVDMIQFPEADYEALPLALRPGQRQGVVPEEGKDYNYYFEKGTEYRNKNDFASSIAFFKKCAELQPDDENGLINLANSYGMANRYADAVRVFEKVLVNDPDNKMVIKNLAITYERMGNMQKADELRRKL